MLRDIRSQNESATRRILRRYIVVLALALALGLGNAGLTTLVRAAPPEQAPVVTNTRHHLKIVYPDPICAGQTYPIYVTPLADMNGVLDGTKQNFPTKVVTGIAVMAEVKDTSIATIKPAKPDKLISSAGLFGAAPDQTVTFKGNADTYGVLTFTLQAKKAGITNLYFSATIPKSLTGTTDKSISPGGPFKVINCKYKVTMVEKLEQTSHGTHGTLTGTTTVVLERQGEGFIGGALIKHTRTENMPPCGFSSPGFENPTSITGKIAGEPGENQLELTFKYEPGQSSSTIKCPTSGTKNNTVSEDPTSWLPTTASFPEEGDTQSYKVDFAHWVGTVTIKVVPIDASSK